MKRTLPYHTMKDYNFNGEYNAMELALELLAPDEMRLLAKRQLTREVADRARNCPKGLELPRAIGHCVETLQRHMTKEKALEFHTALVHHGVDPRHLEVSARVRLDTLGEIAGQLQRYGKV